MLSPSVNDVTGILNERSTKSVNTSLQTGEMLANSANELMTINTQNAIRNMEYTESVKNNGENNKAQVGGSKKIGEAVATAARFSA